MNAFEFRVTTEGIGVLTFDLPGQKVNKFSRVVMAELSNVVRDLAQRGGIRALVIRSAKPGIFIAGADLDEFLLIRSVEEAADAARGGQRVFDAIEALPFPTVAAIGGSCVGGGCELALACDIRIAADTDKVRIGLPETKLGIFPGWGGTHRLTRLAGLRAALDVILAGKELVPKKARAIGLVDEVVPAAILDSRALEVAAEAAKRGKKPVVRRSRGLLASILDGTPAGRALVFSLAKKAVRKTTGGHYPGPLIALESMRFGLARGMAAGQARDSVELGRLATSEVARNLIDLWFWSDRARKESGLPAGRSAEPLDAETIGVLGAGVMGGGIAQLAADKGYGPGKAGAKKGSASTVRVRMKDVAPEALARGMGAAKKIWVDSVKKKRLAIRELPFRLATISPTLDWSGFDACDVTVEAVVEKLAIKQAVLAEWERVARPDAIFASNTSTLPITDIAKLAARPERAIGMHFFNPVHRMPLVEVIRGEKTDDRTTVTIVELAKSWGKTPVVVADRPGFLVNRILAAYLNEAVLMVEEGISPGLVDRAGFEFGLPMGPLTLLDEVGIDVGAKAGAILLEAFGSRMKAARGIEAMAAAGRLGKKVQKGFFRYSAGRRAGFDSEAIALVRGGAAANGAGSTLELVTDRLILPMVKEAAICLDEGVVVSPEKLDLAMIFGIGFPPFRGGICKYADARGEAECVQAMEKLASSCGPRFDPPAALVSMAKSGARYYDRK